MPQDAPTLDFRPGGLRLVVSFDLQARQNVEIPGNDHEYGYACCRKGPGRPQQPRKGPPLLRRWRSVSANRAHNPAVEVFRRFRCGRLHREQDAAHFEYLIKISGAARALLQMRLQPPRLSRFQITL